jgi:ABC transporter substrate binding protein
MRNGSRIGVRVGFESHEARAIRRTRSMTEAVVDSSFKADRLRTLLPRLQRRLAEVVKSEQAAAWLAERGEFEAKRCPPLAAARAAYDEALNKIWLWVDLNALGWREGENLQITARSSNGDLASLPRLAAELVALRPDVLIAPGSTEAKALQAATSDIPIFFQASSDPVGYGLVDSIARPGKNITGIAIAPEML